MGFSGSIINQSYILPYLEHPLIQYCIFQENIEWQKEILLLLSNINEQFHKHNDGFELEILIHLLQYF